MNLTHLLILIGATWRISSLLVSEEGPFEIFERLRHLAGIRYNQHNQAYATIELFGMFTCIWCMSIWIGAALTVAYLTIPLYTTWLTLPLALSAGAILIGKTND